MKHAYGAHAEQDDRGRRTRDRFRDHAHAWQGAGRPGDDDDFERGGRGHGRRGGRRPPWMDESFGGPARRGRGAIRDAALLVLLEQPMHGYQLIQEVSARSGGAWQPSPGAIYPTLQRLEAKGLVHSEEDGDRRVFSLTDLGRTVADRLRAAGVTPWETAPADAERTELRREIGLLIDAIRQSFRAATPEQRRRVGTILAETRRGIYRILSEEPVATESDAGGRAERADGGTAEEGDEAGQ